MWAKSATTVERLLSGSAEPDDEDETTSTRALTTIRCEEDVRRTLGTENPVGDREPAPHLLCRKGTL